MEDKGIRYRSVLEIPPPRPEPRVDNRTVPSDNNRSERELRPTVIARKVSFGSQSEAGAKTREIMMSLLHTLKKRQQLAEDYFKSVLDRLACDIQQDAVSLLFPADSS